MKFYLRLLMVVFVSGCGTTPTENQKQLNDMNVQAGDTLSTHSDPTVAATGKDVSANSTVLAKTLIGVPDKRIIYTPEFAAKLREATLKEFEVNQPWYKKFAGTLLSILGVLGAGGVFAARLFPATAPIMAVATPILSALTDIKQRADANPNDTIHIDQITPIIGALTKLPGFGPRITDKLKDLHLEQIIHSPEAPDMPVPA